MLNFVLCAISLWKGLKLYKVGCIIQTFQCQKKVDLKEKILPGEPFFLAFHKSC